MLGQYTTIYKSKANMENKLIVITRNFPFGKGEEFFETEIQYLSQAFEKVFIISLSRDEQLTRPIPGNVSIFRCDCLELNILEKFSSLKYFFSGLFHNELSIIRKNYKLRIHPSMLRSILSTMYLGDKIYSFLDEIIGNEYHSRFFLYSYWMNAGAYAIAKYRANRKTKEKAIKAFCRSHRGDLYFERSRFGYLPFRTFIINKLDNIFVISQDGKNYLEKRFENIDKSKIMVTRLGINNTYQNAVPSKDNIFRIVSCSFITKVKRINLIIEALYNIEDKKIEWTHIGDGVLRNVTEKLAQSLLGSKENISFSFKGHLSNKEVYEFYESNEIDVFINLSESEGIPVSMMEAMSFSIPIIATNVGGVNEIVSNKNGILLKSDPTPLEVASTINKFGNLPDDQQLSFREQAFMTWFQKYNAEKNYKDFISIFNHVY